MSPGLPEFKKKKKKKKIGRLAQFFNAPPRGRSKYKLV